MPVKEPIHSILLLHKEKEWQTMTSIRLLPYKCVDHQEPLPSTFDPPTN